MSYLRRFAVPFLALALFISVAPQAHAALTESQMQAIISLLSSFGADTNTISNVNASLRGQTPTSFSGGPVINDNENSGATISACPTLTRTLSRGNTDIATNGEVSQLQGFLSDYLNLGDAITSGYYGILTEKYVKQFQARNGIEQVGYVGKQTRAAIARACGGVGTLEATSSTSSLFATPTYGTAPLAVTFKATISVPYNQSGSGIMFFGDGTSDVVLRSGRELFNKSWTHTYSQPGEYDAMLVFSSVSNVDSDITVLKDPYYQKNTIVKKQHITVSGTTNSGITITTPNDAAYYNYGQPLTVSWNSTGSFPKGSTACVTLRTENSGGGLAFPATGGSCVGVAGAEPLRSVTGTIMRTPGYDLAPGAYRAVVRVSGPSTPDGKDGSLLASDESDMYFKIVDSTTSGGITVTAPNGGEQWEEGVLNTVTWTPYSYNPDINPARDVTAYLERKNDSDGSFFVVGKVQESGKASIHWIAGELNSAIQSGTYAEPGTGYYIRVVNNVTGVWDRSDAPFQLLPRLVDLKVNGSDGPVYLTDSAQPVTVSWTTKNVTTCQLGGVMEQSFSTIQPTSGSVSGHINNAYPSTYSVVNLQCVKQTPAGAIQVSDYVTVYTSTASQASSLKITSPNGGEQISVGNSYQIKFASAGISSASIALYRNDQWVQWINKSVVPISRDFPTDPNPSIYGWIPSGVDTSAGNTYKIYITGQKADGTGYIEDKSDAPFSFVASSTDTLVPRVDIKAAGADNWSSLATLGAGTSVVITWTSANVNSCAIASSPSTSLTGVVATSNTIGTASGPLSKTTTFTIECAGLNGWKTSDAVTVLVETLASLLVSKYNGLADQTVVPGATNAKLGSFMVQGIPGINLVNVVLSLSGASNVFNLKLKDQSTGAQIGSVVPVPTTTGIGFVANVNIPSSSVKVIDVYGDVKLGTSGTIQATVQTGTMGTNLSTGAQVSLATPVPLQVMMISGSVVASATIDLGSLATSGGVMLTGSASNIVNSFGNVLRIDVTGGGTGGGGYASVVNGRWQWPGGTALVLPPGTYSVQVSNPTTSGGGTVLATGTLIVSSSTVTLVVNAGSDRTITLPTNTITPLNPNVTSQNNSVDTYQWTNIERTVGTATSTITNATTIFPTFSGLTGSTVSGQIAHYTFRLTVTSSLGKAAFDDMVVTVLP